MKRLEKSIKSIAKEKGFKAISNSLYQLVDDIYIIVDFLIVGDSLRYNISVKKRIYDDLFWEIMGFDNFVKRESIRINGAFSAPRIYIHSGDITVIEESDVALFFSQISEDIIKYKGIFKRLGDYVIESYDGVDSEIIKCLELISNRDFSMALKVAKKRIQKGDNGRFINENKSFYERIVEMY